MQKSPEGRGPTLSPKAGKKTVLSVAEGVGHPKVEHPFGNSGPPVMLNADQGSWIASME